MNKPEISILLPFRNAEETLAECLDSIALQTLEVYELIAVNDGSTDGSVQVVKDYHQRLNHLRLVNNPNPGLVNALNLGLSVCQTELVARMDADDIMYPTRLQRHIEHFKNDQNLVLSATQVKLFPEEAIQGGYKNYIRWQNACVSPDDIKSNLYVESPIAHPSVCFRHSVVTHLGGYKNGDFPEDYELWLRLNQQHHKMEKIPEVLLNWRESTNRTSRVDPRYSRSAFDQLRAVYLIDEPLFAKHHDRFVIWGAGVKTRKRTRLLRQLGVQPLAWIDVDKKKIGKRLENIPVYAPDYLQTRSYKVFVLIYVTNRGAREQIVQWLEGISYQPGVNYIAVG